jgi:ATP-dependent NAD(P)H-hydrate dehydratase
LEKIAKALEGPTIVRKGAVDGICNGTTTLHCDAAGSKRRAGGQVKNENIAV